MNEIKKQERRMAKIELQNAGISYISLNNDLSLRDDGQHECLNCGELFSVEKLR